MLKTLLCGHTTRAVLHAKLSMLEHNMMELAGAATYMCSGGCPRWSGRSIHQGSSHRSSLHAKAEVFSPLQGALVMTFQVDCLQKSHQTQG